MQEDSIVSAPGYPKGSKMVKSTSGKRPHLVKCAKGGRFSCDSDCPNWKALGICSHSVAVAQVNACLAEYTDFIRRSKHLPSVTQLLLTGLPGGVGNKGNRVSRKRKREEINDRVALSTVHKSQDRPAATLTNQPVTSCTATAAG